jgi:hypothetical protein
MYTFIDSSKPFLDLTFISSSDYQPYGNQTSSAIPVKPYTKHPSTTYPLQNSRSPYESQSQQQSSKPSSKKIGDVCYYEENTKDYHFECHIESCANVIFGRYQELERHHYAVHGGPDTWIWCPVKGCERSKAVGKKGFPGVRKDKLREHALNAHNIELEF